MTEHYKIKAKSLCNYYNVTSVEGVGSKHVLTTKMTEHNRRALYFLGRKTIRKHRNNEEHRHL